MDSPRTPRRVSAEQSGNGRRNLGRTGGRRLDLQHKVRRLGADVTKLEDLEAETGSRADNPVVQYAQRDPSKSGKWWRLQLNLIDRAEHRPIESACDRANHLLVAPAEVVRDGQELLEHGNGTARRWPRQKTNMLNEVIAANAENGRRRTVGRLL